MHVRGICSLALLAWFGLVGCGRDDVIGTYEDEFGMTRYEFQRQGRVYVSVLGTTVAGEYRLEGDRVVLDGPQGTVMLTRRNGQLHGPMGLVLVRRE